MNVFLIVIVVGYLIGCVHGSQLVGKLTQINLKERGTKNSGASNATLILGWRYGLVVAMIDIGKAVFSLQLTVYLLQLFQVSIHLSFLYLVMNGLFVIVGHNYPMTMNFNGGKGTASFFGVLLFLNWKLAIISLFIALIISFISNYFVLGTLSGYVTFTIYTGYLYGKGPALVSLLFTSLFLIKHAENFRRIMNNEEVKLRALLRKEAS